MVKYKVNLKFKDNNDLNDILINVLKINLQNMYHITCKNNDLEVSSDSTHYSYMEGVKNVRE